MERFLENLKNDLDEMSEHNLMITVKRSDLVSLIEAYEKLKQSESAEGSHQTC